jgi:hypothetical protein
MAPSTRNAMIPSEGKNPITMKTSCLRTGCLAVIAVGGMFAVVCTVYWVREMRWAWQSERYFDALRKGTQTDTIVSMEIDCDGERMAITNRESVTFLEKAFTTLKLGGYGKRQTGRFHELHITFVNGECNRISVDPNLDMTGMRVCFIWRDWTITDDDVYYDAEFSDKPPAEVKHVLERLIGDKSGSK